LPTTGASLPLGALFQALKIARRMGGICQRILEDIPIAGRRWELTTSDGRSAAEDEHDERFRQHGTQIHPGEATTVPHAT
jgi:hypothetical protein